MAKRQSFSSYQSRKLDRGEWECITRAAIRSPMTMQRVRTRTSSRRIRTMLVLVVLTVVLETMVEAIPELVMAEAIGADMDEVVDHQKNLLIRAFAIEGVGALSDKQILQILRYLQKHPCEGHYYCDYMNACAQLGEYAYGITPSIPIREAHDRVVSRVKNKHDMDTKRRFETAVASEDYLYLTTCACEEDEEVFGEDPYMVMAPKTSDNLFRESENMHNCVRIYVKSVADRSTRIYFLRRKEEPDKSFGTIEVSSDGKRLIQAKAFGNRRLPRCAQQFVIKWCRHKAIKVQTWDIEEMPYGIA